MKIIYTDKEKFKRIIARKGYNPNSLSLKIGRCRQFIRQSLEHGAIGAESSKKICELLNEKYEDIFKII